MYSITYYVFCVSSSWIWAGDVTRLAESLPSIHRAWVLSSVLHKQSMVMYTCNFSISETEAGESTGQGHLQLHSDLETSFRYMRSYFFKKWRKISLLDLDTGPTWWIPLFFVLGVFCVCVCACFVLGVKRLKIVQSLENGPGVLLTQASHKHSLSHRLLHMYMMWILPLGYSSLIKEKRGSEEMVQ